MNKHNLIKVNIKLVDQMPTPRPRPTPTPTPLPTPVPTPSVSIDPDIEEGVLFTDDDRYNYELDMSELIAEEKRSEEYVGVRFCE